MKVTRVVRPYCDVIYDWWESNNAGEFKINLRS